MSQIAIQAENLSKQYSIGTQLHGMQRFGYNSLRNVITDVLTSPWHRVRSMIMGQKQGASETHEVIWALRDMSFNIMQGEIVGIIGRNGAGKSTLLKILSRITEPTSGEATIYGRVGSLLEVGTGFHPELTGRENIYLNGAILGMKHAEIVRQFDEIIAFAEVEKFVDTPVKHYSSGMYLRLAFAVAAHLESEILLVDEVLAVGDAAFQKKCLGKMSSVANEGRTVLFVSHNMVAMRTLCQRGILLTEGQLAYSGPIGPCIRAYMKQAEERSNSILSHMTRCHGDIELSLITINGLASDKFYLSSDTEYLTIEVTGHVARPMRLGIVGRIYDLYETPLGSFSPSHEKGYVETKIQPCGPFRLAHSIVMPKIIRGEYYLSLFLIEPGLGRRVEIRHGVRLVAEGPRISHSQIFEYDKGVGWILLPSVPTADL